MRVHVTTPDFAIGSDTWPGLAKLAEECGELVQVIGKLIATGGVTAHWDGSDLQVRLTEELGDVQGALEFVRRFNPVLDQHALSSRAVQKFETFKRWHQEQTDSLVHKAEAWRRGQEPHVEFGWHCLTCGEEGTAFSATIAENMVAFHIESTNPIAVKDKC